MKARVNKKEVEFQLLQIANMNYGQMQRWSDFVPLEYELEVDKSTFIFQVNEYFAEFRRNEIEENDVEEFAELAAYKGAGYPDLDRLLSDHPEILEGVLKFNDYDIIHRVVARPIPGSNYYYSINSLASVHVREETVILKGVCFQSDYVEHTYSCELPRRYALLRSKAE
ncbi:hypothetical protein ACJJIF_03005 [Microbulbifer sp. SSSA002]|uniref:hypothetical protein n=1 Tax=unclassified Microbulbifer TaxID=2619833 RepID=UPI004039DD9D